MKTLIPILLACLLALPLAAQSRGRQSGNPAPVERTMQFSKAGTSAVADAIYQEFAARHFIGKDGKLKTAQEAGVQLFLFERVQRKDSPTTWVLESRGDDPLLALENPNWSFFVKVTTKEAKPWKDGQAIREFMAVKVGKDSEIFTDAKGNKVAAFQAKEVTAEDLGLQPVTKEKFADMLKAGQVIRVHLDKTDGKRVARTTWVCSW